MAAKPTTVEEYLASLPEERREAIAELRQLVLENLHEGFSEGIAYGMLGYGVSLELFPEGYLGDPKQPLPYVSIASQKNYMAIYLMGAYGDGAEAFKAAYKATGKRLDMGKSCVRFRSLDDLPLELIAKEIASKTPDQIIESYRRSWG